MNKVFFLTTKLTFFTLLAVFFSLPVVGAQVMQSSNYKIISDSVNFGGGLSSSSNYVLESTAGEMASGDSSSASFNIKAGYQQMQEVYIALSSTPDIVMSPAIAGISGGTADGSTDVIVTTDSTAGYQMTIVAENSPAMVSSLDSIADYVPAAAPPDFTFNIGASDSHFGYSPEGDDVVQRFLDNGTDTCNTGSNDTSLRCWDGLDTTAEVIAQSAGSNHPDGVTTTVNFRVGIGGAVGQTNGTYFATTTITALSL